MKHKTIAVKTIKYVLVKEDMVLTYKEYDDEIVVFNTYSQALICKPDGFVIREVIFRGSIDV